MRLGLVRADVLRDAAGLTGGDGRLADGVEQRRLAVVDVAHDRDDRGPRGEIVGIVLEELLLVLLVGGVADDDLALDLAGDELHRVVAERLRDGHHLAEGEHDLDDLCRRDAQGRGEILDRDARLDDDRTVGLDLVTALAAAAGAGGTTAGGAHGRARSTAVNDDAALALAGHCTTGAHGAARRTGRAGLVCRHQASV